MGLIDTIKQGGRPEADLCCCNGRTAAKEPAFIPQRENESTAELEKRIAGLVELHCPMCGKYLHRKVIGVAFSTDPNLITLEVDQ